VVFPIRSPAITAILSISPNMFDMQLRKGLASSYTWTDVMLNGSLRIFCRYVRYGVKGIKIDFVNTGPQMWTKWLMNVIRRCAEYSILVNVHDAYRPTGFTRTYPNLLTLERIRGNEHFPSARHNATLPFTRFPAGAGDYTSCFYDKRRHTTIPHQLGMSVIVYSPLQSIFWYDRPSAYEGEPEVEFFSHLPTVWNDTRVLMGSIGEYAVELGVAVRSGMWAALRTKRAGSCNWTGRYLLYRPYLPGRFLCA